MKRVYFYFAGMILGTVAGIYSTLMFIFGIHDSCVKGYLFNQAEHAIFFYMLGILCTIAANKYIKRGE